MKRVTDIQQRSVSLRRTDGCGKRSDAVAEVTERRAAQQGGEWFSRFTLNYTSTDRFESDKERVKHEDDGNKNKWVSSTQSKRESSSHSKTGASRTITNRLLRRTLKGRPWVSCRCPMSAEKKASNDDDTVEKSGNPNKLFVGNLPFTFKAQDLADLFRPYGNIQGAKVRAHAQIARISINISADLSSFSQCPQRY